MSRLSPKNERDPWAATRELLGDGSDVVLPNDKLSIRERNEIVNRIIEAAQESTAQRKELAIELKQTMSRYDPVSLIGEIARDVHSAHPDEPDRATAVFSWDAKLEHLLGLALALDPVPTDGSPPGAKGEVMQLVDSLFEAESSRILLRMLDETHTLRGPHDAARLMLRLEHLMDRMEGYTQHLEIIHHAVFEPLRDRFIDSFGFCPADIVTVVSSYVAKLNAEQATIGDFMDLMGTLMSRYPIEGGDVPTQDEKQRAIESLDKASSTWRMSYIWKIDAVVEASGVPRSQVAAMFSHLSVAWGCQPSFLLPDDPNFARLRPAVQLDENTYFVPIGWNFVHGFFPWITDLLQSSGQDRLLEALRRRREVSNESLTRGALQRVFGDLSMGPLQYDHEGEHGEIDALVATGNTPLVVECKAHSLTPAGRRGLPLRVERVVDDIVSAGTEQLARAGRYLLSGSCEFADKEGDPATRRLSVPAIDMIQILVTFERMDPLASTGTGLKEQETLWAICLADLLLATDLLATPAEFFDYAALRANLRDKGITVYVEADALATYLKSRFRDVLRSPDGSDVLLGYAAGPINDFYTLTPFGVEMPRPTSAVPADVLAALGRSLSMAPESWSALAKAVMRQDPMAWKKWTNRQRRKGRSASDEFRFNDPPLIIRTGETVNSSGQPDTPVLVL